MSRPLLLGCIADDFTGATDLANNLVRAGMRVVQFLGVPADDAAPDADAIVIALKSRTIPPAQAVDLSLAALDSLRRRGARQIYFKYCSTFDSTASGNIGPVIDALLDALGCDFTIATPALPDNQRTVYKGHLFVGNELLSESGMRNHPLTPMTDANLVRVLQPQTRRRVALIEHATVTEGAVAIERRIAGLRAQGVGIAIVDAISNEDLFRLAPALRRMPLVTAGSGVAIALPSNHGLAPSPAATTLPNPTGLQAIVSGSCSVATNRQVSHFIEAGRPVLGIDPLRIANGADMVGEAIAWAAPLLPAGPVLVHSTAEPERVRAAQQLLGAAEVGGAIERTLARIAQGLVASGVRQLVVAGGETSGACVQALGITQLRIGAQIDPGVPWCHADAAGGTHLALKSGNFGSDDFFTKAFLQLASTR